MTRIKFCGLTRAADIGAAVELAVDAVGFVFWPKSPRALPLSAAADLIRLLPPSITPVGVFVRPTRAEVDEAIERAGIRVAQVHGMENPTEVAGLCDVWFATSPDRMIEDLPDELTILLDAADDKRHGGTGNQIDWDAAGRIAAMRRVMLAGGLTAHNVGEAIRRAQPYGVDVSSGIEERPGVKNVELMRDFVSAVRRAGFKSRRDSNG